MLFETFARIIPAVEAKLQNFSRRTILFGLAAGVLFLSLFFLFPSPVEFAMDDAYIHLMYAQNLADHGRLFFSYPDEVGLATSSPLWVFLLAGGIILGVPGVLAAKILGIGSLIALAAGLFFLLEPFWPRWKSLIATLLVLFTGNVLWFSLSGMETTLFLALGVTALLLYRAGRFGWLGFALGLLILVRPEGLALALALGLADLVARRRLTRDLVLAAAIAILISLPWFVYLEMRTGDFLPTSASGKQFSTMQAMKYFVENYHFPPFLQSFSGLLYPFMWVVYLLEFVLGGISLPAPRISVNGASTLSVDLSLWAIPAVMLFLWLIMQAGNRFFNRARWSAWVRAETTRVFLILFLWVLVHNLVYMVFLPMPGTATRYGAVNYIVLWLAIVGGLSALSTKPHVQSAALLAILFVGVCNLVYWNRVYDANIEHMQNVRITAAEFIRDEMPEDVCAAFDIGALRYFGERPIVEIAGLIDTEADQWVNAGTVDQYLQAHDVTCLVVPGRAGHSSEGVYDIANILKLDSSPLFDLEYVNAFEIDRARWLLGYLPTANYQASVAIYRLDYK